MSTTFLLICGSVIVTIEGALGAIITTTAAAAATTKGPPPPPPSPGFQCDYDGLVAKPHKMKTCAAISKALNVLDGISLGVDVPFRGGSSDQYMTSYDGIWCYEWRGDYYPTATAETRAALSALEGVGPDITQSVGNSMEKFKNCKDTAKALTLIVARQESGCNQKGSLAQDGTCNCDAGAVGTECYSDEITCKGKLSLNSIATREN